MRVCALLLAFTLPSICEVRTMSIRQAVETALKQNSDVIMARFEEQKAAEQVRIAREPFTPKVIAGSGLAYVYGFPMSIEGSAPSIFQVRAIQSLYNKPKSYEVAAARENARGTAITTAVQRDEVAHRTAILYLSAERAVRCHEIAQQQTLAYGKVLETLRARANEGRELPIEVRRAELRLAQGKQRAAACLAERNYTEAALSVVLGFGAEDRVQPIVQETKSFELPADEVASVTEALANNKEVKRLESAMQARGLEARSARAARLPQFDLVAQYGLFAKFNNYEDFFQRFQRHNAQLGVSISLPILAGSGASARASQADIEVQRLRTQVNAVRERVTLDTRRAWVDLQTAGSNRELAKLDLDVAREQLSVTLAQFEEGRVAMRQVEELRSLESEKWLAYYEAQNAIERAQLDLLRLTGTIIASLR
jgi:outer membrane protein